MAFPPLECEFYLGRELCSFVHTNVFQVPDSVWNSTGVSEPPGKVLPWAPPQDSVGQPPAVASSRDGCGLRWRSLPPREARSALPDAPGSNCCPCEHSPGVCAAGGSGSHWPASRWCRPSDCVGCRTRSETKTPVTTCYQHADHCPQAPHFTTWLWLCSLKGHLMMTVQGGAGAGRREVNILSNCVNIQRLLIFMNFERIHVLPNLKLGNKFRWQW